jgi:hypothetical protein
MKNVLACMTAICMMSGIAHATEAPAKAGGQDVNLTLGTSLCQEHDTDTCEGTDPGLALTVGYAFKFNEQFGAGLDIDYAGFGGDLGENVTHMGAYAMGHFYLAAGPVNLDIGAGVGYSSYGSETEAGGQTIESAHSTPMGIKAGLAINYPISKELSVGLDINYLMHGKAKATVDGEEVGEEIDANNQLKAGLVVGYAL